MPFKVEVTIYEDGSAVMPSGDLLCISRSFVEGGMRGGLEQTSGILLDVRERRACQDLMYGSPQDHSQDKWALIAGHELGEVMTNLLKQKRGDEFVDGVGANDNLRDEWLDVAATAVAAIENLDRDLYYPDQASMTADYRDEQTSKNE